MPARSSRPRSSSTARARSSRSTPDPAVRGQGQVRAGQGVDRRSRDRRQGLAPRRRGARSAGRRSSRVLLDAIEAARADHGADRRDRRRARASARPGSSRRRSPERPTSGSDQRRCEEYEASTPYFPFRAIVRDVLGVDAGRRYRRGRRHARARPSSDSTPTSCHGSRSSASCSGIDLAGHARDRRPRRPVPPRHACPMSRCGSSAGSLSGIPTIFVIEDAQHLDEAQPGPAAAPVASRGGSRQVLIVTREGVDAVFPTDEDDVVQPVHRRARAADAPRR